MKECRATGPQGFGVSTKADGIDEYTETFWANITSVTVGTVGNGSDFAAIADMDPEPVASLSGGGEVNEDAGTVTFTVTLDRKSEKSEGVTVYYSTADGMAKANGDYDVVDNGSVTFNPGDDLSKTISVSINNDDVDEYDENFTVRLTGATNATISGTDYSKVVTILDNDPEPKFSIQKNDEFDEGQGASFTVTMTGKSEKEVSVKYRTVAGTATADADYTSASAMLSFTGTATSPQTVTVTTRVDGKVEEDETFTVELYDPVNGAIESGSVTGTILDKDTEYVSVESVDDAIEAHATGCFRLVRNSTLGSLSVSYTMSGTATNGTDYLALSGTAEIPVGSEYVDVVVDPRGVYDDLLVEGTETAVITLDSCTASSVSNRKTPVEASVGEPSSGTMSIADNDTMISLQAVDTIAKELSPNELLEDDVATFLLTRTGSLAEDVYVDLLFSGTADPEDYQLTAHGEVVTGSIWMPAGVTSVEVTLTALHDDMMAASGDDPETALVEIAPAADGSYSVGPNYSQTFSLYDTSDWAEVATNPQRKPFPQPTVSHPAPPASGSGYTVVIVMGGADDRGGSERNIWTQSATTAFPGAYIYNDVNNATAFANVLAAFPAGSVSRVVLGGHGTIQGRIGVQPANNNTETPAGYDRIDSVTLGQIPEATRNAMTAATAPTAVFDVQACGVNANVNAGSAFAELLGRQVRFAIGTMQGWNQTPVNAQYNNELNQGRWETASPPP